MKEYKARSGEIAFYLNTDLIEKYYNLGYDIYEIEDESEKKLTQEEVEEIVGGLK